MLIVCLQAAVWTLLSAPCPAGPPSAPALRPPGCRSPAPCCSRTWGGLLAAAGCHAPPRRREPESGSRSPSWPGPAGPEAEEQVNFTDSNVHRKCSITCFLSEDTRLSNYNKQMYFIGLTLTEIMEINVMLNDTYCSQNGWQAQIFI